MTLQLVLSSLRSTGPRSGAIWCLTLACGHTVTRSRPRRWWWPVRAPKRVRCEACSVAATRPVMEVVA
jgi:hypothetical protein